MGKKYNSSLLEGYNTFGKSKNTRVEFSRCVSFEEMKQNIEAIANNLRLEENHVCYVFDGGGNDKTTYQRLQKNKNISVILTRISTPWPFKFFGLFIPSLQGLVKINKADAVWPVVEAVLAGAITTIYVFDRRLEEAFVQAIKSYTPRKRKDSHDDSFGIKNDSGYIIYSMDAENFDEGVVETVSLGTSVSLNLLLQ